VPRAKLRGARIHGLFYFVQKEHRRATPTLSVECSTEKATTFYWRSPNSLPWATRHTL